MTRVQKLIAQILAKLDELEAAIDAQDPIPALQVIETRIQSLTGKLVAEVVEG